MFFFNQLIGLYGSFFAGFSSLLIPLFAFSVIMAIPAIIKEIVSYV